jgi:Wnt-binding factor required for Wnt secretion.
MEIKDSQALYFDIAHIELYVQEIEWVLIFKMEYINPSYQHTVRNFKFVMLIIALISSTIYYKKATKGRVIRLVSEQGLILLFSGAVILLNDPLFVISYYLEPGIL